MPIIRSILLKDYFYFTDLEKSKVIDQCNNLLLDDTSRFSIIEECFNDYFTYNNTLILDGFIHFRLQRYIVFLDSIVEDAVGQFILEREYDEFISLLKMYVQSEGINSSIQCLHLIYHNNESILLDNEKNCIDTSSSVFDVKYLSDISFSSNDYALNAILSLLPQKLYIHLCDSSEDEFISTLKLIFESKAVICSDCPICHIYSFNSKKTDISK